MNNKRTYQPDTATWLQKLDVLQQENILLKNTVAEIIRHDVAGDLLDAMEQFLNKFIDKDAALELLRYDIARAIKLKEETQQHEKLRREISLMEEDFLRIKAHFNLFTAQHRLH